ncbi:hypothetical protein GCM10007913_11700 [Devosia yakushimensis]|uniref:Uncharacterized protein n=1 Tax=Devosia yakushimensis TaxID=470028 RepID=A0ABQ5UC80_9HYPH|nr:hypothetical protein [Devosia yakushimensis]GLQ09238.1 hypothetical protein GCM10007913_11700 [Devosia yakushimensis]
MAKHQFTEEELQFLTEEERAGLLDESLVDEGEIPLDEEEEGDEDDAAAAAVEGASDAEPVAEKPDPKPEAPAVAETPAVAPAADAAAPVATDEAEASPRRAGSALPEYKLPANFDQSMQDLRSQKEALAQRFDDGELTAKEYNAQNSALDDQMHDLRDVRLKATMSEEAVRHNYVTNVVPDWLADHTEYRVGSPRYNALDLEVRRFQDLAHREGRDPFDPQLLDQAHEIVAADFGTPAAPKEEQPKTDTPPARTPAPASERVIPPSLGSVPAADATDLEEGSRFAYLDRLQGEAYEQAMAKLSDADRDTYLAS